MKKLFNLLVAEWRAAFDLKSIVLNDCNDVKVHAKSLQHLSEEERETLLEFVTQAEIARQTGRDTIAGYGITVVEIGTMIYAQSNLSFKLFFLR